MSLIYKVIHFQIQLWFSLIVLIYQPWNSLLFRKFLSCFKDVPPVVAPQKTRSFHERWGNEQAVRTQWQHPMEKVIAFIFLMKALSVIIILGQAE